MCFPSTMSRVRVPSPAPVSLVGMTREFYFRVTLPSDIVHHRQGHQSSLVRSAPARQVCSVVYDVPTASRRTGCQPTLMPLLLQGGVPAQVCVLHLVPAGAHGGYDSVASARHTMCYGQLDGETVSTLASDTKACAAETPFFVSAVTPV